MIPVMMATPCTKVMSRARWTSEEDWFDESGAILQVLIEGTSNHLNENHPCHNCSCKLKNVIIAPTVIEFQCTVYIMKYSFLCFIFIWSEHSSSRIWLSICPYLSWLLYWHFYVCPSASHVTLEDMSKINVNQTITKHRNELSVCIVYEMYCVQIVEYLLWNL